MSLVRLLLGRPLANRESSERKIGAFEGIPAMGLDGLGSSAYGPEAALTVLIPLGAASLAYIGPVMVPIIVLLGILYVSYRQTIRAYPTNGGAYTVSKDNLGVNASLLAAAALMVDYVLNVAVGISAGVAALISAIPALHPYILHLCLGILALVTIANLRGTLDAGRLFAPPTYTFIVSFLVLLAIGMYKAVASGGHPDPVIPPPPLPPAVEVFSLWLLLRAFSSGCTAMTGVEAVSNGVGAFREPRVKYAHRTLTAIVAILATLLGGIAYLASAYGIGAMDQTQEGYQSVLSQLAGAKRRTPSLRNSEFRRMTSGVTSSRRGWSLPENECVISCLERRNSTPHNAIAGPPLVQLRHVRRRWAALWNVTLEANHGGLSNGTTNDIECAEDRRRRSTQFKNPVIRTYRGRGSGSRGHRCQTRGRAGVSGEFEAPLVAHRSARCAGRAEACQA
jgi:hypothetical protein